jgi:MoxR-like ATPase
MNYEYRFYGDQSRRPSSPHPDSPDEPEHYIASPELIEAVNLALYLRRPLLLEGEAGCGKTRLARAVAYELGLPFYPLYVRSTTKAQDCLYTYDAILRLHDVHVRQLHLNQDKELLSTTEAYQSRDPRNPIDYRKLGPIGKGFCVQECPAVILIDEIDKADIDFPNDLLTVLDSPWEFDIPETNERIKARHHPLVIVTSNREKGNLPAPFLRRCIYFFVEFPDRERLKEIVRVHYKDRAEALPNSRRLTQATERFMALRESGNLHKLPGTSEFLDWIEILTNYKPVFHRAVSLNEKKALPFPELLLKLRMDWQQHRNLP